MSLMFFCEYVPEAKVDEDRQARLMEIASSEEPLDWDDGYDTLEDCRAAVAGAIAYLATVPNIETQRIDIPGAIRGTSRGRHDPQRHTERCLRAVPYPRTVRPSGIHAA